MCSDRRGAENESWTQLLTFVENFVITESHETGSDDSRCSRVSEAASNVEEAPPWITAVLTECRSLGRWRARDSIPPLEAAQGLRRVLLDFVTPTTTRAKQTSLLPCVVALVEASGSADIHSRLGKCLAGYIVGHLYGDKSRKHFVTALLKLYGQEDSEIDRTFSTGDNPNLNEPEKQCREALRDVLTESLDVWQVNASKSDFHPDTASNLLRQLSVILNEPSLFFGFCWDRGDSGGDCERRQRAFDTLELFGESAVRFLSRLLVAEARHRCPAVARSILREPPPSESRPLRMPMHMKPLEDSSLDLAVSCLSCIMLSKHLNLMVKPDEPRRTSVSSLILNLTVPSLLALSVCPTIPREILTTACFVLIFLMRRFCSSLSRFVEWTLALASDHMPEGVALPPFEFGATEQGIRDSLLTRLAFLRGILIDLSNDSGSVPDLLKPEFARCIELCHAYFVKATESADVSWRLYAMQALNVWLRSAPDLLAAGLLLEQAHRDAAVISLDVAAHHWDSSIAPLKKESMAVWDLLLLKCMNNSQPGDTAGYESLYQMVLRRAMDIDGANQKLQYWTLERLTSVMGAPWLLQEQPYLIDYLLLDMAHRGRRNAALRLLGLFIELYWEDNERVDCKDVSVLNYILDRCAAALAGHFYLGDIAASPEEGKILNQDCQKVLLPRYPPNFSQEKFSSELATCLVPFIGKKWPSLIGPLFIRVKGIKIGRVLSEGECYWFPAEAHLVLAACLEDQSHWIQRGSESSLEILGARVCGSSKCAGTIQDADRSCDTVRTSVSEQRYFGGLAAADPLIRLPLLEGIITTLKYNKLCPTLDPRVLEAAVFCLTTSFRPNTAEERSAVVAIYKKYMNSVFDMIRRKSEMRQPLGELLAFLVDVRYHIHTFFSALVKQLVITAPHDRRTGILEILCHIYDLAGAIELKPLIKSRLEYFEFLYRPHLWSSFSGGLISSWGTDVSLCSNTLKSIIAATADSFGALVGEVAFFRRSLRYPIAMLGEIKQRNYFGGATFLATLAAGLLFEPFAAGSSSVGNADEYGEALVCAFEVEHKGRSLFRVLSETVRGEDFQILLSNSRFARFVRILRLFDSIFAMLQNEAQVGGEEEISPATDADKTSARKSLHGPFRLLRLLLSQMPKSSDLMSIVKLYSTSDTAPVKEESIASAVVWLFKSIWQLQWALTCQVIQVLSGGIDSVLLCKGMTEVSTLSEDKNENTSVVAGEVEGKCTVPAKPVNQRIMGVDCRGHPYFHPTSDVAELVEDSGVLGSWLVIKESCECLAELLTWTNLNRFCRAQDADLGSIPAATSAAYLQPVFLEKMLHHSMLLLLGIKHPAAMDKIYSATSVLCSVLFRATEPSLNSIPEAMLNRLQRLLSKESADKDENGFALPPPLRRSYSFGLAFLAIHTAEPSRRAGAGLLPSTMALLLNLADKDHETDEMGEVSGLKVHSLNILRTLVRNTALASGMAPYLGRLLSVSLKGLASQTNFPIRNAANLLYGSLLARLSGRGAAEPGSQDGTDGGAAARYFFCIRGAEREYQISKNIHLKDVLKLFPPLHRQLITELEEAALSPTLVTILRAAESADDDGAAPCDGAASRHGATFTSDSVTRPEKPAKVRRGGNINSAFAVLLLLSYLSLETSCSIFDVLTESSELETVQTVRAVFKVVVTSASAHARTIAARILVNAALPRANTYRAAGRRILANYIEESWSHVGSILFKSQGVQLLNGEKINNNALHGCLSIVLEAVNRPLFRKVLLEDHFDLPGSTVNSENDAKTWITLSVLVEFLSSVLMARIAPLNHCMCLQIAEALVQGFNSHDTLKMRTVSAKRDLFFKWVAAIARDVLCMEGLYSSRAGECTSAVRVKPLTGEGSLSAVLDVGRGTVPGVEALRVSAVRLHIVADATSGPIIISNLVHEFRSETCVNQLPLLNEALRVMKGIMKRILRAPREALSPSSPFRRNDEFVLRLAASCNNLVQKLSSVASPLLAMYNRRGETASTLPDSLRQETLIRIAKFIETLQTVLARHEHVTTVLKGNSSLAHFHLSALKTLSDATPKSARLLRVIVSISALRCQTLSQMKSTNPLQEYKEEGATGLWEKVMHIFEVVANPSADSSLRFAVLSAAEVLAFNPESLQSAFLDPVYDPSVVWRRCIVLTMDECPEIRLEAANVITQALRRMSTALYSKEFARAHLMQYLSTNIILTPSMAVFWGLYVYCNWAKFSSITEWLHMCLAGKSLDLNVFDNVASPVFPHLRALRKRHNGVERNSSAQKDVTAVHRSEVFEEEASNVFHEDAAFLAAFVTCYCDRLIAKMSDPSKYSRQLSDFLLSFACKEGAVEGVKDLLQQLRWVVAAFQRESCQPSPLVNTPLFDAAKGLTIFALLLRSVFTQCAMLVVAVGGRSGVDDTGRVVGPTASVDDTGRVVGRVTKSTGFIDELSHDFRLIARALYRIATTRARFQLGATACSRSERSDDPCPATLEIILSAALRGLDPTVYTAAFDAGGEIDTVMAMNLIVRNTVRTVNLLATYFADNTLVRELATSRYFEEDKANT